MFALHWISAFILLSIIIVCSTLSIYTSNQNWNIIIIGMAKKIQGPKNVKIGVRQVLILWMYYHWPALYYCTFHADYNVANGYIILNTIYQVKVVKQYRAAIVWILLLTFWSLVVYYRNSKKVYRKNNNYYCL